ncbi:MAG: hypothetical protein ACLQVA_06655 [Candidatus Brocadiia bacterium]
MSIRQIILLFMVLVCLAGAAYVGPACDYDQAILRGEAPIGPDPQNPQVVLLTHVLGGFKGLMVDALWLRAGDLQEQGKFWELYQLYTWMGKLEPGIEEIWDFNGWNMAYNLVAELDDSEARWQWVERAILWLTNEGLKANPRSAKIMERISWIYWHKIGRDTDMHHFYYKHRLALVMHRIFLSREEQDIPAIVKAPKELKGLLADADVAEALSRFELNPPEKPVLQINDAKDLFDFPPAIVDVLKDPKYDAARKKIFAYTTARILRERYGMHDLDLMAKMEENFGKFDWRLPEPHAIYWAMLAKNVEPIRNQSRQINYDRLLMYSLQATCRRGLISYLSPNPNSPLVTTFDLSKIKPIDALFRAMLGENPEGDREHPKFRAADSVRDGHVQFLQEQELNLYFAGFVNEAQKYHMELYRLYDKPHPYEDLEHVCVGKVEKLVDEYGTMDKIRAFVDDLVVKACVDLCLNKAIEAHQQENLAKRAWEAFSKFTEAQHEGKIRVANEALPTWKEVLKGDISQVLQNHCIGFPPQLIPVLRNMLHVPPGAEIDKLNVGEAITPEIPPSSPPPK